LPDPSWKPSPGAAPIAGILKLLLISVGVPFLLLSSTGPLLQNWYAHLELSAQKKAPYFLYALSNAGSLLRLLSYPLFLEPIFRLSAQSWFWGAGFGLFALCCAACAWQAYGSRIRPAEGQPMEASFASDDKEGTTPPRRWLWFTLPMLGSVMLLATTNFLTQDVAPNSITLGSAAEPLKTTEPAETTAPSPIVTPGRIRLPIAIQLPVRMRMGATSSLKSSRRTSWLPVQRNDRRATQTLDSIVTCARLRIPTSSPIQTWSPTTSRHGKEIFTLLPMAAPFPIFAPK